QWIPYYQERYKFMGVKPTVNIGSIEGGWPWRASRTPGFCNLYVDVRFPPQYHALDIKQEISNVLDKVKSDHGVNADLDIYVTDEWSEVSANEYVAESVKRSHQQVFSKPAETVYFSWSSDANILTRHGIIAVNYGPSGGQDKETRGTMYIPNLVGCGKVYTIAALDICSKSRTEVRNKAK
ncbi:MAG: peptidase dimerization domain-containing protein, partial [Thaumarchaeota archaeon]|nr:peptidase dimerization domain-containing protein [Nitrososphaerota archaeon]